MPRPVDELLAALYESHGPALRRFVQNLTRNAALTEDVVQETMVRAWQRPQVLERDADAARAWLFTVARNLVIDDARSARSRREVPTKDEDGGGAVPGPWIEAMYCDAIVAAVAGGTCISIGMDCAST
mgnify:CR=1 FL=1